MASRGEAIDIAHTRTLLDECLRGDQSAWRALFDANFDFVHRVARRLGTPSEEVDDVCQEVFVVAFRKLPQFVSGRFTTWLYRITANIVSHKHRTRRVRRRLSEIFLREPEPAPSPERDVEKRELERAVGRVLEAMSDKKREVFVLYELEGLSGQEIAERVGIDTNAVWVRLHHARKEFARLAHKKGLGAWRER
jgi:RNA polymerase sigma-70 factor, ECF subfamily